VKLACDIAGLRKLDCGHVAENEAACSAADLVLIDPCPGAAGAHANAEARNVVVENDLISDARIEFQGLYSSHGKPHHFIPGAPIGKHGKPVSRRCRDGLIQEKFGEIQLTRAL
jgi:hypothetical protein